MNRKQPSKSQIFLIPKLINIISNFTLNIPTEFHIFKIGVAETAGPETISDIYNQRLSEIKKLRLTLRRLKEILEELIV